MTRFCVRCDSPVCVCYGFEPEQPPLPEPRISTEVINLTAEPAGDLCIEILPREVDFWGNQQTLWKTTVSKGNKSLEIGGLLGSCEQATEYAEMFCGRVKKHGWLWAEYQERMANEPSPTWAVKDHDYAL
jgi:hypothetical protein